MPQSTQVYNDFAMTDTGIEAPGGSTVMTAAAAAATHKHPRPCCWCCWFQ